MTSNNKEIPAPRCKPSDFQILKVSHETTGFLLSPLLTIRPRVCGHPPDQDALKCHRHPTSTFCGRGEVGVSVVLFRCLYFHASSSSNFPCILSTYLQQPRRVASHEGIFVAISNHSHHYWISTGCDPWTITLL